MDKNQKGNAMQNYNIYQNSALLILRVITAAIFYVAAYIKIPFWSSAPEGIPSFLLFATRVLSIAEPLGATAVLIGFLTRWAASGLTIILIGAIIVTKYVYGIGFITPTSPGWDFPLAVLAGCLVLIAFGAGKYSIDERKKSSLG
ncbi:MAG: DoxX family protein [Ignavibacteria bacterium]|nr:DoxX family protein [Ignavibacteria bacterium]